MPLYMLGSRHWHIMLFFNLLCYAPMLTQPAHYASKFNPLCFKFSCQKGYNKVFLKIVLSINDYCIAAWYLLQHSPLKSFLAFYMYIDSMTCNLHFSDLVWIIITITISDVNWHVLSREIAPLCQHNAALCSMLQHTYYAKNYASIMCQCLLGSR